MDGTVKVLAKGRAVPSARTDATARKAEYAAAIKRAGQLAEFIPPANTFVAGHDSGNVSWFRFFPRNLTVGVGQTVRFSISSKSEIHTVALGAGTPYFDAIEKDLVMVQPQPSGPPRLQFSPLIFLPSDPRYRRTRASITATASSTPGSRHESEHAAAGERERDLRGGRNLQVRVHDPPGDAGDDHGHLAGCSQRDALTSRGPLACGGRDLSAQHRPCRVERPGSRRVRQRLLPSRPPFLRRRRARCSPPAYRATVVGLRVGEPTVRL